MKQVNKSIRSLHNLNEESSVSQFKIMRLKLIRIIGFLVSFYPVTKQIMKISSYSTYIFETRAPEHMIMLLFRVMLTKYYSLFIVEFRFRLLYTFVVFVSFASDSLLCQEPFHSFTAFITASL